MAIRPAESRKNARRLSGIERKKLAVKQPRPRIMEYLADNHYKGLDREHVVKNLVDETRCGEGERASIRSSIAKTLGRLIQSGYLTENLAIGEHPKSKREASRTERHRGYVAVTVSPTSISNTRLLLSNPDPEIQAKAKGIPPTQEELLTWIAKKTADWSPEMEWNEPLKVDGKREKVGNREFRWPREIVLLGVEIMHSAAWDILINISYINADHFMKYVRDVVQMAPHVTATQTMFVAGSVASSAPSAQNESPAEETRPKS